MSVVPLDWLAGTSAAAPRWEACLVLPSAGATGNETHRVCLSYPELKMR